MLRGVTRLLAGSLNQAERKTLVESLDPHVVKNAQSALAVTALDAQVKELTRKLEATQDDKRALELKLSQYQDKVKQVQAEHDVTVKDFREKEKARKKVEEHPLYGRLLYDFGYKKVYASEPGKVVDKTVMPVWERQRIFRPERAKTIAKYKKNDKRFGFPGVISIYDLNEWNKRGIVDGQHRIGGLEILLREGVWSKDQPILTEVYGVDNSEDQVGDLFKEINQAQPALEIDLPGSGNETLKEAIDQASEIVREANAEFFKESINPRPPHLNIDKFRQMLFESDRVKEAMKQFSREDQGQQLFDWLTNENAQLSTRDYKEWSGSSMRRIKSDKMLEKAHAKCTKLSFFLGLDESWL